MNPAFQRIKTCLLLFFALFFSNLLSGQTLNPYYQEIVSKVSYDTILSNLQKLSNLGIKEPGTAALNNTADWLVEKYQSYGYTNISRDNFVYNGNQLSNIVVTKTGTIFPPKYLVIDGHYDTYQGPGINDNGSGVVSILEIARLLSHLPCSLSIRFINFSAEEEGLIGSQHYVDQIVVPTNMNIMLVFNIDEVGGVNGMINNTITCERDEDTPTSNNAASYSFTDTLVNLTQLYSNLLTKIYYAYGSDYVPFQDAGEVITGFYESNESPYPHSPNDVLENMSPAYVTQVAKAATGAALYFAGSQAVNTSYPLQPQEPACIFPNPASNELQWKIQTISGSYLVKIIGANGQCIAEKSYTSNSECSMDISRINAGLYSVLFYFDNGNSMSVRFVKGLNP
ncbi:MAG: M28 family peptidase [Bacteroidetes bacterium]|nr:M28 family peptidase [Bacteroidota bacterium]